MGCFMCSTYFFMEAGFALLEAGFVRSKNAISIIAKVIIDITFGVQSYNNE